MSTNLLETEFRKVHFFRKFFPMTSQPPEMTIIGSVNDTLSKKAYSGGILKFIHIHIVKMVSPIFVANLLSIDTKISLQIR